MILMNLYLAFIIIGGLIALPLVLGLLMRVSASHVFFSVMAGELIARYFGEDAYSVLVSFSRSPAAASYSEVILLTLPIVLTAVFLKGSLSRGKTVLHTIPLIITGVVYAAFMMPVLPTNVQQILRDNPITNQFMGMNTVVIGFVVFFQLVALWILNSGEKHGKHKKH